MFRKMIEPKTMNVMKYAVPQELPQPLSLAPGCDHSSYVWSSEHWNRMDRWRVLSAMISFQPSPVIILSKVSIAYQKF